MFKIIASAPGKVIVSGEHAVVYGYPALLAATDLRLTWEVELPESVDMEALREQVIQQKSLQEITNYLQAKKELSVYLESDIPIGSGLGSSAAFSVSLARVLLSETASLTEVNELAYQLETIQHGKPSGGDNTVSSHGGVLWYRKEHEQCKLFESLTPRQEFPQFWLIDSGQPVESTKEMVDRVRELRASNQNEVDSAFREMERISRGWFDFLLGEEAVDAEQVLHVIRQNHAALTKIQVVSPMVIDLISQIESIGGAAKITGAGGFAQGSGMVLVYHQDTEKLRAWAKKQNVKLLSVHLGGAGLQHTRMSK